MRELFHPKATAEAKRATSHYKNIRQELGRGFRNDLEETVSRILKTPKAWHPLTKGYRRCLLRKFPFGVIYQINEHENTCLIFAVMHSKRKPGYWKSRKF